MSSGQLPPNPYVPNLYNQNDYENNNISLTLATADLRYLKLIGGTLSGLLACNSSLTVNGSLSLNGTAITSTADQINYLSGTTPGTATASQALILNSSRNITNINNLSLTGTLTTSNITITGAISATTFTSTNNGSNYALQNGANSALIELSGSPSLLRLVKGYTLSLNTGGCVIESGSSSRDPRHPLDMGSTARNDTICLYDDVSSFYGMSANSSATQISSGGNITFYSACSQASPVNSIVATINSAGNIISQAGLHANSINSTGLSSYGMSLHAVYSGSSIGNLYTYNYANSTYGVTSIHNNNLYCTSNGWVTVNGGSAAACPLEVRGFANFTKSGSFGYLSNSGAGTATGFTSRPFSIQTDSAILCLSGEIDVFSDEMKKKNIKELDEEKANSFINNIKPITYKYKKGDDQQKMGFSAQQLVKYNFHEIVGYTHDEDDDLVEEIIESETGELFKKEKHTAFVVNLMGIIPILTKCVQISNKKIRLASEEAVKTAARVKDNEEEIIRLNNRLNSFKQCRCSENATEIRQKVLNNNKLIFDLQELIEEIKSDYQQQINDIVCYINDEVIEIKKKDKEPPKSKEVLATAPIAIEYLESIQK